MNNNSETIIMASNPPHIDDSTALSIKYNSYDTSTTNIKDRCK